MRLPGSLEALLFCINPTNHHISGAAALNNLPVGFGDGTGLGVGTKKGEDEIRRYI